LETGYQPSVPKMVYDRFCCYFFSTYQVDCQGDLDPLYHACAQMFELAMTFKLLLLPT
jgi:hypothetical protein